MRTVAAVDVGGTSMKGALVAADGVLHRVERRPTGRRADPAEVIEAVLAFVADLAARGPVEAVGLALPGIVDERTGTAITSSNLGWRDVPFGELARERTGLPVAIGHDVRAGGLAEAVLGAGHGVPDFLFLPIGTGVAAAMVVGGELYRGPTGWAGELGHVVVRPEGGEPCFCGRTGCLEAYASAAAIVRRHGDPSLTAEEIIVRAESGEPRAHKVWTDALDTLATAIDTYTMLLDPSLVVVGGGLADAGRTLLDPLAGRLGATMTLRPPPPLTAARLGPQAAVLGAAILAQRLLDAQS